MRFAPPDERRPPERLLDATPEGSKHPITQLLRACEHEPPLDALSAARIERRLRRELSPGTRRAAAGRWMLAVAAGALVVSSSLMVASATGLARRLGMTWTWLPAPAKPESAPTKEAEPRRRRAHRVATTIGSTARPAEIITAPPSTPSGDGVPVVPPAPGVSSPSRVAPSTPPHESPRSLEVALFSRAVAALRSEGDPRGALRFCQEYLHRFPLGTLAEEIVALKAEAHVALAERPEALAVLERLLERLGHSDSHRGLSLRLMRAELRAETACEPALGDFDHLLALRLPPALAERALYGRSVCRARMNDQAGADADARAYLERFPDGAHAAGLRKRWGL